MRVFAGIVFKQTHTHTSDKAVAAPEPKTERRDTQRTRTPVPKRGCTWHAYTCQTCPASGGAVDLHAGGSYTYTWCFISYTRVTHTYTHVHTCTHVGTRDVQMHDDKCRLVVQQCLVTDAASLCVCQLVFLLLQRIAHSVSVTENFVPLAK